MYINNLVAKNNNNNLVAYLKAPEKKQEIIPQKTLLITVLRRQRQADVCEFEACLVYRASSRMARAREKPCLNKQKE